MPKRRKIDNLLLKLFFVVFFIVSIQVKAQCPTVINAAQTFCATPDPLTPSLRPRISDLVATDNGGGVVWYTSLTGGTPLGTSVNLDDGTIYYADADPLATIPCAARIPVTVSISGEPPTNHDRFVGRCSSEVNTVDQLDGDGTNIEWFNDEIGGTPLPGSTPLVNGEEYWVQQTENGCTSRRLPTLVTIIDPGEPTGPTEQFFCFDANNPVVFRIADLSATGTEIRWYSSPTSTAPLDPSTPLVNNATYYATQTTFPCESTGRFATNVQIDNLPDPGTDGTLNLCDNSTASINLFDQLNGTPDPGGTWSGPLPTTGGDLGRVDTSLMNPGTFVFNYTLAAINACPEVTSTVTINVQEEPDAGEDGVLEICTNEPTVDLFTLLGGSPDAGGTWSPALTSGTGVFDPFVDPSGTYTYIVSPTAPCTLNDTATITVTVVQAPFAGPDVTTSLCATDSAIDLFTLLTGADPGGVWSPTLNSGTGVFDPALDTAGAYTYTLAASAVCPEDEAIVTVSIIPTPQAGDDNSIDLCSSDSPVDLFTIIGGSPDTGGSWSPALTSGTGVFDPGADTSGVYTYTVNPNAPCTSADTASITVNLSTAPVIGTNATITVCGDDANFDLFPLLGTGVDTNGTWSGPSTVANGNTGTFDPSINTSGAYVYTIIGAGVCDDASATVTVTVVDPEPTLITDGEIFCIADSPLISDLINNVVPDMGGTIAVYPSATSNVAFADADVLVNGDTYHITETDLVTGCVTTNRLVVTVQINDPQIPLLSTSSAEFCLVDDPLISDLNSFVDQGNNVIWFDAPTNGNRFNETDTLTAGTYYALEEDVNGCQSPFSNEIIITINDNAPPTLNAGGNELCGVEMPTLAELEANLSTDPGLNVVWYDAIDSTTALSVSDLLLDNTIYYAATVSTITGCESNDRLEIEVDLTNCDLDEFPLLLPDGFSPNGDGINDTYSLENVQFLYEDYTIEIYNRYGNLLYMGNNSTAPWDGTSNQPGASGDKVVPNGVYFYIFNYNRDNVQPVQGRIYLNR